MAMIYRKFLCFLFFSLVANAAFSQSMFKKKIETSFMAGIVYNAVESNNAVDFQGITRTPIEFKRTWAFQYQPSLMAGVAFKNQVWRKVATQIEVNLLTTRQKATFDETKSVNNNQTATVGTVQFSTLYLHIPIVMRFRMEEASDIEIGFVQLFRLYDWGREDLTKTVFSEQAESPRTIVNNNPIITYSPPKVLEITKSPDLFTNNYGFLVGVNYKINPKTAVRLRYERELGNFSKYGDLHQSRLSLNFLFKWK
jgi:hypothetical protein